MQRWKRRRAAFLHAIRETEDSDLILKTLGDMSQSLHDVASESAVSQKDILTQYDRLTYSITKALENDKIIAAHLGISLPPSSLPSAHSFDATRVSKSRGSTSLLTVAASVKELIPVSRSARHQTFEAQSASSSVSINPVSLSLRERQRSDLPTIVEARNFII